MSFINFFKSLVPNFERTRVLEELELARKTLLEDTLPPFQTVTEQKVFIGSNPFKSPAVKRINSVYARETGARSNFVTSLTLVLSNLAEGFPELEKYVEQSFSTKTVDKLALTYNKVALLRVISLINFVTLYSRRVLLYTYSKELIATGSDFAASGEPFTKSEVKWLEDHLTNFSRCVKIFAQPVRQILNTLEGVPDIVYDPEKENDVKSMVGAQKMDPLRIGFIPGISSVIWFIGSQYVEFQARQFHRAVEERRALELRLAQLQAARLGQVDAATERTIAMTEQRLRDLNYNIAQMERKFGV